MLESLLERDTMLKRECNRWKKVKKKILRKKNV